MEREKLKKGKRGGVRKRKKRKIILVNREKIFKRKYLMREE